MLYAIKSCNIFAGVLQFFNGNNEPLLKGKEVGAEESNVPAIEDDDDIIEKLDEMINGC